MAKVYRQKYNYYDEHGRRRGKTFSAPTKAALRALIEEWEESHLENGKPVLSVSEALQRYMDAKRGVLSPSTIRSYEGIQLSSRDGYLLELTGWTKGSQAS